MLIRKQLKFEMGHVVRNAWSRRCSMNIHGHSYLVEFIFKGKNLDKAGMIVDFGLLKKYLNDFVDSFDHSLCLWEGVEKPEIINFFKENFERVITVPVNSSAEEQAKVFFVKACEALQQVKENHAEHVPEGVKVYSVRVHETKTGWAEAFEEDIDDWDICKKIWFSEAIKEDWSKEV